MRRLLPVVLLLAACGGKASTGPAWPKSAGHVQPDTWEEDGGESIEPREVSDVAAIESSAEPEVEAEPEPETTVEVTVEPPPAGAGEAPPEPPVTYELIEGETIIIEGGPP